MKIPEPRSADPSQTEDWSREKAESFYYIDRWGSGYFSVNSEGEVCVRPLLEKGGLISLAAVRQAAYRRNLRTPLLLRFQDLLRHRVMVLNEAFSRAIQEYSYQNQYRGVYPIKVNQLREVVEEILDAGEPYGFGLEVGSKPEMYAALAIHSNPESLIICNGYKDSGYIRTALLGRKLQKKVVLVAEKVSEVAHFIRIAREMEVRPWIGLRVRLHRRGSGAWATSGGEDAKFGLSTLQILQAVDMLKRADMAESLKLLHFHIGSQIPDILTIKQAVREATRYYAKLWKLGQKVEYLDVGGGLAIDYDGSKSSFHSSMNYTLEEYARDVVYNIQDICLQEEVPQPLIVSESGRALVAHHSVLLVEAFGTIRKGEDPDPLPFADHKLVSDLVGIRNALTEGRLTESLHDMLQIKEEAQNMFELGLLDLPERANIEALCWTITRELSGASFRTEDRESPEELVELRTQLADQHICNFSVFQSLLDHWALGQLFPIVPISRLDQEPSTESRIVDITCDSDGKISKFIDLLGVRDTLPLHKVGEEPYFLGIFLTGAYQDILGDFHNLFGRVCEVHVFLAEDEQEGFYIDEVIPASSIGDVLELTQYDLKDLAKRLKSQVDRAIREDKIRPGEAMQLLEEYRTGFSQQTYLVFEKD